MCTRGALQDMHTIYWDVQGRSQEFAGGAQELFLSDLETCMSRSDMLRMAKPCDLLGGFGGMLPGENFFKWCNLVYIWIKFFL